MPFLTSPSSKDGPLVIGATIPDFYMATTKGTLQLHEFLESDPQHMWTLLIAYPGDYDPVSIAELATASSLLGKFAAMGIKLMAVSCTKTDSVNDHLMFSKDVLSHAGLPCDHPSQFQFPIAVDRDANIANTLGMVDAAVQDFHGRPVPSRWLVILKSKTVQGVLQYPVETAFSFDELFRVLNGLGLRPPPEPVAQEVLGDESLWLEAWPIGMTKAMSSPTTRCNSGERNDMRDCRVMSCSHELQRPRRAAINRAAHMRATWGEVKDANFLERLRIPASTLASLERCDTKLPSYYALPKSPYLDHDVIGPMRRVNPSQ